MTLALAPPWRGAHGPGDGAVGVRAAGGQGPADKGGVVAAAVLRVDHQHHVQQVGLFLGVALVSPEHPQEVFCRGQVFLGVVNM